MQIIHSSFQIWCWKVPDNAIIFQESDFRTEVGPKLVICRIQQNIRWIIFVSDEYQSEREYWQLQCFAYSIFISIYSTKQMLLPLILLTKWFWQPNIVVNKNRATWFCQLVRIALNLMGNCNIFFAQNSISINIVHTSMSTRNQQTWRDH